MQEVTQSQIAELLREQNQLLREIQKQGAPLSLDHLTPSERKLALDAKLSTTSLNELAELYETDPILRAKAEAKRTAHQRTLSDKLAKASGAKSARSLGFGV